MPHQSSLSNPRQKLFDRFDRLGVPSETVDHPPIMTVDEGRDLKLTMPGRHTKNLFLKDKKGNLFLLSAHCDTVVDLVAFGKAVGAKGRLSFGKPELMIEILGVAPGSVTPFALINADPAALRAVAFDAALFSGTAAEPDEDLGADPAQLPREGPRVWFHPLENTASTAIYPADLLLFARDCGFSPVLADFAGEAVQITTPEGAPIDTD
ncbi:MAG: prolyl-tRNA synthetase associated domain-containing protein [Pseudomonadota bacterium]